MELRLVCSFNEMDRLGRVELSTVGSLIDVQKYKDQLQIGKTVTVYEPGEFEAKAVLDFDAKAGIWVASPIWSTVIEY